MTPKASAWTWLTLLAVLAVGWWNLASPVAVLAYDHPRDDGHGYRGDPGDDDDDDDCAQPPCCEEEPCDECNSAGSPVILRNGNYILHATDLTFIVGQQTVRIERTYNTQETRSGDMGNRWLHSGELRAIPTTDGQSETVLVRWPDGHMHRFVKQPDASYSHPLGSSLRLQQQGSAYILGSLGEHEFYQFDAAGYLQQMYDRNGNGTGYNYDPGTGCLDQMVLPGNRVVTFTRGANGKIASISDWAGRTVGYAYDAAGNLITVTDPLGHATTYQYDGLKRLTGVLDPLGRQTVALSYDAQGRVSRVIDAEGDFSYTYQSGGTNLALGATASSNSTYGSGYGPPQAIDNNVNTYYLSNYGVGSAWLQLDFASPINLNKIELVGYSTSYPSSGTITMSNGYNRVYSQTGGTDTINLDAQSNVRWLRLTANSIPGGYLIIKELRVFSGAGIGRKTNNADGGVWTYEFDTRGVITKTTDPLGGVRIETYDANYNRTSETDPLGRTKSWTYDAEGRTLGMTDPAGSVTHYSYNAFGLLETITDPLGVVTKYEYDSRGNLLTLTEGHGTGEARVTIHSYDAQGALTGVRDPAGHATLYTYDGLGNQIEMIDPLNHKTTYTYDAQGNRTGVTDAKGQTTTYSYDSLGRLVSVKDPLGNETKMTYTPEGLLETLIDENNHTTAYTYDTQGRIVTVIYPGGKTQTHAYSGPQETITSPEGRIMIVIRDKMDRPVKVITKIGDRGSEADADDLVAETQYNLDGTIRSYKDPAGNTLNRHYDELGRLLREETATGLAQSFTYNANGAIDTITLPSGNVQRYEYDATGRLLRIRDDYGIVQEMQLDAVGHQKVRSDGTRIDYDPTGRDSKITYSDDSEISILRDELNRMTSVALSGAQIAYNYDAVGRLTSMTLPDNTTMSGTYTPSGQIASLTDAAGQTTRYEYDQRDRLTLEIMPDGSEQEYIYDGDVQIISIDPDDQVTRFAYDDALRLSQITYPDGGSRSFEYNGSGNLIRAVNATTTVTRQEDGMGRQVGESIGNRSISYEYGERNLTATIVYSSGRRVTRTMDGRGRIIRIADQQGVIYEQQYDAQSRPTTTTWGNGVTTNYGFNAAGVVSSITTQNGAGILAGVGYRYDGPTGLIATREDLGVSAWSQTYRRDNRDRIVETRYGTLSPDGQIAK